MKKIFIPVCYSIIAATILCSSAFAQTDNIATSNELNPSKAFNMTKEGSTVHRIPATYVNAKVLYSFIKYFKGVQNPEWYMLGKDYLAEFDLNNMPTKVFFSKNGHMDYTLSFGSEKNLPVDIRRAIKSNYVDYNIGRAVKIQTNNQTVWVTNIEDENNLIILRSTNDGLDEMEHYQTHFTTNRKGKIIISQ